MNEIISGECGTILTSYGEFKGVKIIGSLLNLIKNNEASASSPPRLSLPSYPLLLEPIVLEVRVNPLLEVGVEIS